MQFQSHEQEQLNACAAKLEAALPAVEGTTYAAGGVLTKILALIAAIKAGEPMAIVRAVYELLGEFVSDGSGGGDTTNFGASVAGLGMDWKTLLGILATILGLLGK